MLTLGAYVHSYVLQTPFSYHLICEYLGFPGFRFHFPWVLYFCEWMSPDLPDCNLGSQGHNPFLTLLGVNKQVAECRTTPSSFFFKTDHSLIQKVLDLDVRMPVNPCLVCFNAVCIKGHLDGGSEQKGISSEYDWSHTLNWIKVKVLLFLKNTLWLFSVPRPKAHTSKVLKFDPVRGGKTQGVRHTLLLSLSCYPGQLLIQRASTWMSFWGVSFFLGVYP